MARYIAIIDYDAKTRMYGAYFPDAPGCTAMGATEDAYGSGARMPICLGGSTWPQDAGH